jgi:hypothetical protein
MTTADINVIESLADWDTPALSNTGALIPFQ